MCLWKKISFLAYRAIDYCLRLHTGNHLGLSKVIDMLLLGGWSLFVLRMGNDDMHFYFYISAKMFLIKSTPQKYKNHNLFVQEDQVGFPDL